MRFGKPCLQIRIPSRTPLHLSWSRTSGASILPARFSWFGMIHRTKLGLVLRRVTISLASCSLYSCDTVLNMPLRVRAPNWVSVRACCAIPTISAANTKQTILVLTFDTILYESISTQCTHNPTCQQIHVCALKTHTCKM